ncbi:MAG TPA: condensation domain-containing protein, partial [Thermoanaerobaculia bacterium]
LVVVPYLTSRSPEAFLDLLATNGVTVLSQTPSAFRQLIHADEAAAEKRKLALRTVVFGGEALDLQSLRPWFDRRGDRKPLLVNMYGITETTVHVTYRPIRSADLRDVPGSVIGGPIPDLSLHVLDAALAPVPVAVPGELHVGGAGLARGYLGRPELTAERFVPNPYGDLSGAVGARLYRSGDLARRLPNGDVEYLGRIDHQVKVRGFRIELGEIEAALAEHPAVRETVVLARQDTPGDVRLVAYVVAKGDREPTASELRSALLGKLPEHAIPAAFVLLDRLPLTENGKLDRRALPAPDASRPELAEAYAAPRTEVEATLAEIFAAALGLERVGIHDNYFALGGDSIRSIQLIAQARERGLAFTLEKLFQHPTIGELAGVVETGAAAQSPATRTEPFSLVAQADRVRLPAGLADAYPLTRLQAGMLFHMSMNPDSPVYHNVNSFSLRAKFDLAHLQTAVDRAVARHPVLRTSFDLATYGESLQLVHEEASLPISCDDIRHLPHAEQERVIDAFVEVAKGARFDLTKAPQLRMHVHRRGDDAFQLTVTENHAILDGWSLNSTFFEVFDVYGALVRGEEPPIQPPPRIPFRDFVAREREALASPEAQAYWRRQMDGCTVLDLPRWPRLPSAQPDANEGLLQPRIPAELSDGLRRMAGVAGVPVRTVLLAAHFKVLQILTGLSDLMSGMVTHGRPEEVGGEQTRGLFLNTPPLRLTLAPGSWLDAARTVFA